MYLTLNLKEKNFPLSHLTLRIFLIFHHCGQFIKNWKNLKFLDEKIKVVENLTGIISIYLTLNLEEKILHFLTRHLEFYYFSSLWTVHQKLKKLKFLDEKIKVVENLTGIISIYLTLSLKKILLSHPTLRFFWFFISVDSSSKI